MVVIESTPLLANIGVQMKPADVITVSFADMDRGGKLSKAVVNIIKRTR